MKDNTQIATFAGGCFWCTEAIYKRVRGVISVTPGYTGGTVPNPSYEAVCSGKTGHAEAIQIVFDPRQISFSQLLSVFWHSHDPTTLNRQGNDTGTQYRSAIFYHDKQQHDAAEESKLKLETAKSYDHPIVTEIMPFTVFYPAEDYHKDYFAKNPDAPYCQVVIAPKIARFLRDYTYSNKPKEQTKTE